MINNQRLKEKFMYYSDVLKEIISEYAKIKVRNMHEDYINDIGPGYTEKVDDWFEKEMDPNDGRKILETVCQLKVFTDRDFNETMGSVIPPANFQINIDGIIDEDGKTEYTPYIFFSFLYGSMYQDILKKCVAKFDNSILIWFDCYGTAMASINIPFDITDDKEETIENAKTALVHAIYKGVQLEQIYHKKINKYFSVDYKIIKSEDPNLVIHGNAVVAYKSDSSLEKQSDYHQLRQSPKVITIPKGVESIEREAFKNLDVEEVVLPKTLTNICYKAFDNCTNLKRIGPMKSVNYIDNKAFNNCIDLKDKY